MADPFVTSDEDVIDSGSNFDTSTEKVVVEDLAAVKIEKDIVEPVVVSKTVHADPYATPAPGTTYAAPVYTGTIHQQPVSPVYVTSEQRPPAPHYAAPTYHSAPAPTYVSQPYQGQYPQQYPTGYSTYPTKTSGMDGWAIAALACAVAGLIGIAPFIGSILGIIFGILGLNRSNHLVGGTGRGMSIAGIVIGALGLLLALLVTLAVIGIAGYNTGRWIW